jgi:hypothetical protein
MSDEFGNWGELARLWHARLPTVAPEEVERHARRRRRHMLALAVAEAGAMTLAFVAAVWIAMHTAFVAMSAISMVFFGVSGYLHHRMRNEPEPSGDHDLLTSLDEAIAREEWMLRQLGVGRAVTALTLASIALVGADHLRYFSATPAARLWALLAITLIVLGILVWNLVLTRTVQRRKRQLCDYSRRLGA